MLKRLSFPSSRRRNSNDSVGVSGRRSSSSWRCWLALTLLAHSFIIIDVTRRTDPAVPAGFAAAFVPPLRTFVSTNPTTGRRRRREKGDEKSSSSFLQSIKGKSNSNNDEWTGDFDGYDIGGGDDDDGDDDGGIPEKIPRAGVSADEASVSASSSSDDLMKLLFRQSSDRTAIRSRRFKLGRDLALTDFVGTLGFEEVTDWEYYYPSEDPSDDDRKVVQPNPFDEAQPRRTRASSGSLVRIFRGEFVGSLGGMLRSQGLDNRVLVKEFSGGDQAQELAQSELTAISRLQAELLLPSTSGDAAASDDDDQESWIPAAAARYSDTARGLMRKDNSNVAELVQLLQKKKAPFVSILGEVDLTEEVQMFDANAFYRALGVPPPSADAIWVVYEYAGLSSLQQYTSEPPALRRAKVAPKRGIFGMVSEPPPLPPFRQRAAYVKAILRGTIEAVAALHEAGIVHRSIGRSSVILSSSTMDKREASSVSATDASRLRVKLSDFGFAAPYEEVTARDREFCARARTFGLAGILPGDNTVATANFAMAEDLHAVGFVALGLLLTSLAELPKSGGIVAPTTDEDTLQRLFGDIFDKDLTQFRDYIEAEDEVWSDLLELLDENGGAGWTVLETLLLARERAAKMKDGLQMFTIRGLLSNPFFASS